MRLLLVRHGEAAPDTGGGDANRPLTPAGREAVRVTGKRLRDLGMQVERMLHSPLRRAEETADLLAPAVLGDVVPSELLVRPPGEALFQAMGRHDVALVGHYPHLPTFLAWLVTGTPDAGETFAMPPGGVAWLEGEPAPGGMRLVALIPPAWTQGFGTLSG